MDPNRASEQAEVHDAQVMYYTYREIGMNHSCDQHSHPSSLHYCFCAGLHNTAIVVRLRRTMTLDMLSDPGMITGCIRSMI